MRTAVIALCTLAVAVAVVAGVRQARDGAGTSQAVEPLSRAQVSRPIPGAPPPLAALRGRVNELSRRGVAAFDAELRALRGHPVVVNLWASWCGPCRRELPLFQREALRRGAEVAFLGVNVEDDPSEARRLAERYPMPYPSIVDPRANLALGRFGSRGLPVTAYFDARGKRVTVEQGQYTSQAQLAAAIERYARG